MEENNRKGPGVFYAVVGVATLVVAIIGATFAYFSAATEPQGADVIKGETNDVKAALSLVVTRDKFTGATATEDKLVPAVLSPTDAAGVKKATDKKCEEGGYTGCHVYKIVATSTQSISVADILVTLNTTATKKENWKYVVYTSATDDKANPTTVTTTPAAFSTANPVDIKAGGMTAEQAETFFLMVYLENVDSAQNAGEPSDAANETGSYSGSITFQAAGNQVKADFSA